MAVAERFSIDAGLPSWIRFQHIERYHWACQFVAGKAVVDAACGTAFGTQILAKAGAQHIYGFDIAADAIAQAQSACAEWKQLELQTGDVTKLPLADQSCDVFVSFETIEHVVDDAAVVCEAARVLRPGGIFLCSTPNRELTNPGTTITDKPFNPHHIREYNSAEFCSLLGSHFPKVELYGQTFYPANWKSVLTTSASVNKWLAVRLHQFRKLMTAPANTAKMHEPRLCAPGDIPEFMIGVGTR